MLADLHRARAQRGEGGPLTSRRRIVWAVVRLVGQTDAFGALVLYRCRTELRRRGIPVLPGLAHRLSVAWAQLSIDDRALIHPGIIVPHGQIVIDGDVEIHGGARLRPWITIAPNGDHPVAPTLEHDVSVGTGATILGPITVGAGARIGANAVVVDDVPPATTVVGNPGQVVTGREIPSNDTASDQ